MIEQKIIKQSSVKLYQYILDTHWNGQVVEGPDPGVRFNSRIGRFIKSYLRFLPWSDSLIYAQAQKYWIECNWLIFDLDLGERQKLKDFAIACSEYLLSVQQPEGYWNYPNPEWRGRIATVEGNYATMGLLATYRRTGNEKFLDGAKKWYRFAVDRIGFQIENGRLAINYFCDSGNSMVPNNSASALIVFAQLAQAANDRKYLEKCDGMVDWLNDVQLDSGELPYALAGPGSHKKFDRIHFLCYQYNAFQFLNLAEYYELTQNTKIFPLLEKLALFLSGGITRQGNVRYDCYREYPEVVYYNSAVGAALYKAEELGIGDFAELSDLAYNRVLSLINDKGKLEFHSKGNYGFLSDRRSYPRYMSMVLYHLLLNCQIHARKSSEVL